MCRPFTRGAPRNCTVSPSTQLAVAAPVLRAATISLTLSACVIPYAIPPLKAELGGGSVAGHKPVVHAGGGTHLASAVLDREMPVDVGVGGFIESDELGIQTTAGYAEASLFVDRSGSARTSVGVRGELRYSPEQAMGPRIRHFGAKLRVERELFKATSRGYSGSDHCGAIGGAAHGTGGVGVFAEAGSVMLPDQRAAFTATAGVTLRVPSTVGLFFGIPGCK